ncbi:Amino-acid N-acetyltransferase [Cinnamomum micranthum f. kanehirae]|uniref:Amino-acid N-acetyltransferase n=1 Tax=Cinnamomum micranthum f. kanehirae TaxID=337451 RepID=A0A3S3MV99_9MAGN|nr:Amino-acid N-acetyltransferase [Cinnamomum micranthum f. kanehirae]
MVINTIFSEWPHLERLDAIVGVDNPRSQRVLEKAGLGTLFNTLRITLLPIKEEFSCNGDGMEFSMAIANNTTLTNHVYNTNLGGDIPSSTGTILKDSTYNTLVGGDIPAHRTNTGRDIPVHSTNLSEDIPSSTDTTLRDSTQGGGDIPVSLHLYSP